MFDKQFLEKIINPPKSYRPIPFWSWNERLSTTETRRQIGEMDRAGIGGYFMHARGGLETEYMGAEWMENIAAGVDEGQQRGMGAWAYDENGWPSGFGNGLVNGRGIEFQQKYLRLEEAGSETPREDGHTIGFMRAGGRLFHAYYDVNPFYVDTLNEEVIRIFLEEIYAPYHERFGEDFGGAMPGFFTDEPQISRNGIPWSFVMPGRYLEAYGEELLPLLPQLFHQTGEWRRTRYRFWHLVQELFVTAFSQQIFDWCEAHGCQLTGHMVLEETLQSQLTTNAAVMPHYEFFHIPGMDWLGRHIDPPTTPVQVASVAHQIGHRHVLSETFALTGWNVSFEELKWMLEWQMVRGVTQLCQHLEGYSLRGIRKRDYPPSLFYQQPWWNRYRFFNDAMTRMGMLLSDGEAEFNVLVLHPQGSAWLHFDCDANDGLAELNEQFMQLTHALERAQIPFHYGDERILRRHGSVEGASLRVGRRVYSTVVVPSCDTISEATYQLLASYAAEGGRLVWCGGRPTWVEGMPDARLDELTGMGVHVAEAVGVPSAMPEEARQIQVCDAATGAGIPDITATMRVFAAESAGQAMRMYYFANRNLQSEFGAHVTVPGSSAARFELETGEITPILFTSRDGRVSVHHRFVEAGSLTLFVSDDPDAFAPAPPTPPLVPIEPALVSGGWELELLDPNALTLDVCDVWFDGELLAEKEHVSVVQARALQLEREVAVHMRFVVETVSGYAPPNGCHLVVECPELYDIHINGELLVQRDEGHYRDTSFRMLALDGALREGRNEIELSIRFIQSKAVYENLRRAKAFEAEKNKLTFDTEIEAIYLIGAFGVATDGKWTDLPRDAQRYEGDFALAPLPATVSLENLTPQRLPFFNGRLKVRKTIDLRAEELAGRSFAYVVQQAHIVSLGINSTAVHEWFWRPFTAELTAPGLLREGVNVFELELTCGLRNLLGPHHLEEGESFAVGPGSFFKEPNIWGNRPWNDGYCFVRHGITF
ncbi:MAG: hypothetical protein KAI66_06110 [Lentisphaeria bacterium]|nr:hypothetical protein [Lentisphaeria bacterium]